MDTFNMNQLEQASITPLHKGDIVMGKVLKVENNVIYLDVGYKMEGKIDLGEFKSPPLKDQEIEVMVLEKDEENGEILLSHQQAKFMKAWKNILDIYHDTQYISGSIVNKLEKGFEVDIGVPAFLPFSHIRQTESLDSLRDKQLMFKIIEIKPKTNKVILSRKLYLAEVTEKNRKELLEKLEEGQIVEGVVKNITRFGVFLDINGIDALIPRSELSWGSNVDPRTLVSINERIKAMVIHFDRKEGKVALSLKNLQSNPWNTMDDKYQEGMIAKGKVVKIINAGVFVELEPGIEGYIAKENLSWARHIRSPFDILKVNDLVEFKILTIDKANRKIALGLKQILPNPWVEITKKYFVGQKLAGRVKFIVREGAYIEIEENIEGFISLDDVSWTRKFRSGFDAFKKGHTVEGVIADINPESQLIRLSMKQLLVNPWEVLGDKAHARVPVEVVVENILARGTYVRIENELSGFIPAAHYQMIHAKEPVAAPFKKGDRVKCLILDIDQKNKLAIVSPREYSRTVADKEMEQYIKKDSGGVMRLGDLIQIKKAASEEK